MISDRIRQLAAQPTLRPGALVFDMAYARSVMEARDEVQLEALAAEHPRSAIRMYIRHGDQASMGLVPHDWDGSVVRWPS